MRRYLLATQIKVWAYIGGGRGQYITITGDINGDGHPDAIAAAWPGPIDVHINTGNGVMSSTQIAGFPSETMVWPSIGGC